MLITYALNTGLLTMQVSILLDLVIDPVADECAICRIFTVLVIVLVRRLLV